MKLLDKLIDKRIAEYQNGLLAAHYAEVENMYRQTRGWRHDYRNHIQVLAGYAEMGDLEAVKTYLRELRFDLENVDTVLRTGNKMTDVILNSKISLANPRISQSLRTPMCRCLSPPPRSICASSWGICLTMP